MRLIAMINQKGGVGKTTTAVNVSAGLARWGSRVLLVDLDPQAHASMHLGIEAGPDEPGIYDVLINGIAVGDALRQVSDKLAVIPSHVDLVAAESELSRRSDRESVLRQALQPLHGRFDFIIVDCPPSLGTLTVNALVAMQEVVIPLQPHFLALQGLGMLLETAMAVRGLLNPALRITGIALCMYDKGTRLAQEVDNDVRQFIASASPEDIWHGARVFDTTIRRNIKLAECPAFGRTIFDYAPGSNGAEDYGSLARELLEITPGMVALLGAAEGQTADAAQGGSSAAPTEFVETGGEGVE
ncbi:MAG: AAA family ATPase, partial [Planctomycetes bacterium]|nr:AAA family ATPase [Planctomycetota bacterium]